MRIHGSVGGDEFAHLDDHPLAHTLKLKRSAGSDPFRLPRLDQSFDIGSALEYNDLLECHLDAQTIHVPHFERANVHGECGVPQCGLPFLLTKHANLRLTEGLFYISPQLDFAQPIALGLRCKVFDCHGDSRKPT
ncbi:MAG: hypothetical protein ACRERD_02755 [Candidatus Binatia bacterium]